MFFPEALYLLSQRDQQVTWLDPVFAGVQQSDLLTTVSTFYDVPDGRALILQNAHLHATPGAAQNRTGMQISVFRADVVAANVHLRRDFAAAAGVGVLHWVGSIIITPGWRLMGRGSFDAAANANIVDLKVAGLLIPIGNVQRV